MFSISFEGYCPIPTDCLKCLDCQEQQCITLVHEIIGIIIYISTIRVM